MDKTDAINIAKNYIETVKGYYSFQKAFLFGSYAKGTYREESDIDIALIFKKIDKDTDMQLELMRIRRKIDSRIEPHPFLEKDFNFANPVAFEILKNGLELNMK